MLANPDIRIVKAAECDLPVILSFIKQLAEYEKLSDKVSATEDILKKNLFSDLPYAKVLIAYYKDKPAGIAIYFFNFSTFLGKPGLYLEDLFVNPDLRGFGIGKALFLRLAEIAKELDCGRFEWSVLNWNTPAIDFYKRMGAAPMDEWTVFRLDEQGIEKLIS